MATYTMTQKHGAQTFDAVCSFKADDGSTVTVHVSPAKVKMIFGFCEANGKIMSEKKSEALYQAVKPLASEIFDGVPNEYKFEFTFSK